MFNVFFKTAINMDENNNKKCHCEFSPVVQPVLQTDRTTAAVILIHSGSNYALAGVRTNSRAEKHVSSPSVGPVL